MRRAVVALLALVALAAAGTFWLWPQPPEAPVAPPERGPNVLVIVWDTVRADRLSLYGYDRPTTPRLEAWARDAAVFEHAWSPGIWTLSAHASVFTGLPVESTGADERWLWLDHGHTTLAEHFGENGYDTFSFAANALLSTDTNLIQGFRVAFNTWQPRFREMARAATRRKLIPGDRSNELAPDWQPPPHGAHNAEWARAEFKEAGPLIGKGLLRWLDVRPEPEKPWLAYLNLMEAHTPRIPSKRAREAVIGDPELIQRGLEIDAAHINLHFYNFGKHTYTPEELEAINAVYDATLRDLDDATADLLRALDARGELDDTIVVLTSDHGENLGDHQLFNHRFVLYESLLHVPLVIRYPSGLAPGRHPAPVSTIDLYATLCELAGLPVPEAAVASKTLTRTAPEPPVAFMALPLEREARTVQRVHPDVDVGAFLRMGHATVAEGLKWIEWESSGVTELYDLPADPGEAYDLSGIEAPEVDTLVERLRQWRAEAPVYDPQQRGPDDAPATVRANQRDLMNQLEMLGYVAGEDDE